MVTHCVTVCTKNSLPKTTPATSHCLLQEGCALVGGACSAPLIPSMPPASEGNLRVVQFKLLCGNKGRDLLNMST